MLTLTIDGKELYDNSTKEFITIPTTTVNLEHSLLSISKWESKWNKPFLTDSPKYKKTFEEQLDYFACMSVSKNVSPELFRCLTVEQAKEISDYVDAPMTATWFSDDKQKNKKSTRSEIITSEVIYYWMVSLNIPFECQKWHLNKLLTLIRVCSIKNAPEKKMPNSEMLAQRHALNMARRQAMHTHG